MKVFDVMQKNVDFVTPEMSLFAVAKLIFGNKINGVPVCERQKIIGFISETDILSKFHPTIQEFTEDPFSASNFESMEKRTQDILNLKAKDIMSRRQIIINADDPLLKADSLMRIENVGRLPVVDDKGNLVGIISMGDIFKALVGEGLPLEEDEQFHDWLSKRYDIIIDQKARLSKEIPDLVKLFKELNVRNILDIGSGTGVHSIALAEEGFDVVGIDRSNKMISVAWEKAKSLPSDVKQRIKFVSKDYKNLEILLDRKFDAAIFMGSALSHIENPQQALQEISRVLADKAVIICQVTNYDKVIKVNKRFFAFDIRKSPYPEEKEQAFLRFFDEKQNGFLTQNLSVFVKSSKKWIFRNLRSMRIYPLTKENLTAFLKKIKFSKIKYYGGEKGFFYDYLFKKPFKPTKSDVFTIVARK